MFHDPKTNCRVVKALGAASYAATTTNGTGFDKGDFDYALVVLDVGAIGASATVTVTIEESSALGSGYAAVTGAAFSAKADTVDDDKIFAGQIKLSGRKKFLRAVVVVGTAASILSCDVILMGPARSESSYKAQGGSEAVAFPTALTGAGSLEFSV